MGAAVTKPGLQLTLEIAERARYAAAWWDRRDLSAATATNRETLRRYLKGTNAMPAWVAARLCATLKVSPEWLLLGIGAAEQSTPERHRGWRAATRATAQ